jgi:F420-dependent oxidoreductase-like protein
VARKIRFGIQTPPQYTSWAELQETWKLIDELRYDTAWLFDHFLPIFRDPSGPCFEGWTALGALVPQTTHVRAGILVTGNTYRHPAVLAKIGATLDHVSGGRLIMGLGAGWYELEHASYGIPFYTVAERIRRLGEAAEIIKLLWTEKKATFEGRYYAIRDARCEPKPLQRPRPPLMIGGGGEKLTLLEVAKHADLWNGFGSPDLFRHKLDLLRSHCASVGRDFNEIEVSWLGRAAITSSESEKQAFLNGAAQAYRQDPVAAGAALLVGTVEEIRDRIERFVDAGVTHFILSATAPFDHTLIRRFSEEVIPFFRNR